MPQVEYIEAKSILTAQGKERPPSGYTISPYTGCAFGCLFCYVPIVTHRKRAEWGRWVWVKENAPQLLRKEVQRGKLEGRSVFMSTACDPYQPIERHALITQRLLEILLDAGLSGLRVQTRSPLVTRDIDLLRRFGDTLDIGFTICTDDDRVRKAFEPTSPPIEARLAAMRELKDAGINVQGFVGPILPCNPERLAAKLKAATCGAGTDSLNYLPTLKHVRDILERYGWERYATEAHYRRVRQALEKAGL